jgi:adenine-specific DNA-methyltransferase
MLNLWDDPAGQASDSRPAADAPRADDGLSPSCRSRKDLGAYYTEEAVVRFLVVWGTRVPRRRALDPSCGDGRFLATALARGVPSVVGCDLNPSALEQARDCVLPGDGRLELLCRDFFLLRPEEIPKFDLVMGNPPFIRYQRFAGEERRRALEAALRAGVRLTGLTSSWAPFVLHAQRFLAPGGEMAMVVPAEITQTQYGLPTLR